MTRVIFLAKNYLLFIKMLFTLAERMIFLRIKIIFIKSKIILITITPYINITFKFLSKFLFVEFKKKSNYISPLTISLLVNLIFFLFTGVFSIQAFIVYFGLSLLGVLIAGFGICALGSFYLMSDNFETSLDKNSFSFVQRFTMNVIALTNEEYENQNKIKLYRKRYNLLRLTDFLFSTKTQKEVFEQIVANWQEEYFETLFKKEIWKARWINIRYTYAFLSAMWQKSPIGDLIEFISKIAK